jgi:hypothetical protein
MIDQPSSDFWRSAATGYRFSADAACESAAKTAYVKLATDCDALADRQERMRGAAVEKPH